MYAAESFGGATGSHSAAKVQVLVDRWQKLGGDLPVMEGLRKQYADKANLPLPLSPSKQVRAFICSAMEASKKKRGEKLPHDETTKESDGSQSVERYIR